MGTADQLVRYLWLMMVDRRYRIMYDTFRRGFR